MNSVSLTIERLKVWILSSIQLPAWPSSQTKRKSQRQTGSERGDHTRQGEEGLESAALRGPEGGGHAAHPEALEHRLARGHRVHVATHTPAVGAGAAGLEAPACQPQYHTHHLQGHPHVSALQDPVDQWAEGSCRCPPTDVLIWLYIQ
jgi:hypothetical protein